MNMNPPRSGSAPFFVRQCTLLLLLVFSFACAPFAHAAFPDKPIKLMIGFPAGGPLDTHARLLVDKLQQALGVPVIVDYRAGAGGSIGAEFVAKSAPDGYTLLVANTGTMVINPPLYTALPYDTYVWCYSLLLGFNLTKPTDR